MGTVGDLTGTCPRLTFTLGNKTVRTNAETVFMGGACADIKNTIRAGAKGAVQPDLSILASYVRFAAGAPSPQPTPKPRPQPTPTTIQGPVGAKSGTCPNLSMKVGTQDVVTNSSTRFQGRACADLQNGDMVGVAGSAPSSGGAIVAKTVMSRK